MADGFEVTKAMIEDRHWGVKFIVTIGEGGNDPMGELNASVYKPSTNYVLTIPESEH
jgi:hypothetical protein